MSQPISQRFYFTGIILFGCFLVYPISIDSAMLLGDYPIFCRDVIEVVFNKTRLLSGQTLLGGCLFVAR